MLKFYCLLNCPITNVCNRTSQIGQNYHNYHDVIIINHEMYNIIFTTKERFHANKILNKLLQTGV